MYNNYEKHLLGLVEMKVVKIVQSPDDKPSYGLVLEDKSGNRKIAWIDRDAEGNGPGWLAITGPTTQPASSEVFDAAKVDGCNDEQARAMAFGVDTSEMTASLPPIGWYRCREEYASLFCEDWEMEDNHPGMVRGGRMSDKEDVCPNCGDTNVWKNSSGELQCDNCGYSEGEEQ